MNKPEEMLVVGSADKQKVAEALALHMVLNDSVGVLEVAPSATIREQPKQVFVLTCPDYSKLPPMAKKPDNRVWLPPPGADRHSKKRKY